MNIYLGREWKGYVWYDRLYVYPHVYTEIHVWVWINIPLSFLSQIFTVVVTARCNAFDSMQSPRVLIEQISKSLPPLLRLKDAILEFLLENIELENSKP